SVDVAKPISEAPPPSMRPTWNAVTMIGPKANVSGSTSVACWLVELVYGSELSLVSGTVAVGKTICTGSVWADPDPQPKVKEIRRAERRLLRIPRTAGRSIL